MSGFVDWLSHLQQHASDEHAELDLNDLKAGDLLRIGTRNTIYTLRVLDDRCADLQTNRPNRPAGRIKIMGCTFGLSSTISPDKLFCGGNLEFTFQAEGHRMTHTTSAIRRIELVHCAPAVGAA